MKVISVGLTLASGLPPVSCAQVTFCTVGVAVTGIENAGAPQVPSYWLVPAGMQRPKFGSLSGSLAFALCELSQADATSSPAVPTLRLTVLPIGTLPLIVN